MLDRPAVLFGGLPELSIWIDCRGVTQRPQKRDIFGGIAVAKGILPIGASEEFGGHQAIDFFIALTVPAQQFARPDSVLAIDSRANQKIRL